MEPDPRQPQPAPPRDALGPTGGDRFGRGAQRISRWKLFQTKTTIGTIEITSKITASAEP